MPCLSENRESAGNSAPAGSQNESTIRYPGIEIDDVLNISESVEVWICQSCDSSPVKGERYYLLVR